MNKKIRIILMCICGIIFVISSISLIRTSLIYKKNSDLQKEIVENYVINNDIKKEPEKNETPIEVEPKKTPDLQIDFEGLAKINPDVVGWIYIDGTNISYPLLQAEDNIKYLNRTYKGGRSSLGSIFLECANKKDFTDYNTVIYGHNGKNGAMFGELQSFLNQDFIKENTKFYIFTKDKTLKYRIVSAYVTNVYSDSYLREFADENVYKEFTEKMINQSQNQVNTGDVEINKMVTLSTCTNVGVDDRIVVQGILEDTE